MTAVERSDLKLIFVAQVGAAVGLKGAFRLTVHTADPKAIRAYGQLLRADGKPSLELTNLNAQGSSLVAMARGVSDRNQAEALRGLKLYVPRARFPEPEDEDEVYIADLIGLNVRGVDGADMGRIVAVDNFGAGDLLSVRPATGADFYVPFTKSAVPELAVKAGFVVVDAAILTGNSTDFDKEDPIE